jgi:hypothetical protein
MEEEKIINCWVAYFDILGFKNLLEPFSKYLNIFDENYYDKVLEKIDKRSAHSHECLTAVWFSDSFLIYTLNDSYEAFVHLDFMARNFFMDSDVDMPLRGALSFGHFYADKERNVYIGDALIKACEYAEKQDWVGFVLTPGTVERLSKHVKLSRFLAHESEYRKYQVPVKLVKDTKVELNQEELYAFKFYKDPTMIKKIDLMYQSAKNNTVVSSGVLRKYDNTFKFIKEK